MCGNIDTCINDINIHVVRFHNDIGLAMFMGN